MLRLGAAEGFGVGFGVELGLYVVLELYEEYEGKERLYAFVLQGFVATAYCAKRMNPTIRTMIVTSPVAILPESFMIHLSFPVIRK